MVKYVMDLPRPGQLYVVIKGCRIAFAGAGNPPTTVHEYVPGPKAKLTLDCSPTPVNSVAGTPSRMEVTKQNALPACECKVGPQGCLYASASAHSNAWVDLS